ncbi:hypothetical protein KPZU09_14430 [Klebsiella pneumoniae]|uniref:Uncharacterized protein n=1 Tax=Klebsiella pneumoniae TaxID=573 RepID=A0A919HS62_KLEPN|nr:hypothetical protein KPZU09_14430 [Klebsiella pneumoniae]
MPGWGWGYLSLRRDRPGHALSLTSQQIWLLCALCAGLLLALAIRWLLTPPAALVRVSHVETSLPEAGSDTRRAA